MEPTLRTNRSDPRVKLTSISPALGAPIDHRRNEMRGGITTTQSVQEPGEIKEICHAASTMIVHADNLLARDIDIVQCVQREPAFWPGSALERPTPGSRHARRHCPQASIGDDSRKT